MQVLVNTDNHIEGNLDLTSHVTEVVEHHLARFAPQLTRVEVHLTDEDSGAKATSDGMRCAMEARLSGLQPISVSQQAKLMEQAIDGAVKKLRQTLDRTLGRLDEVKGR